MSFSDHIDYELLAKFFANEASEDEIKTIETWRQANDENEAEFVKMKSMWDETELLKTTNNVDEDKALLNVKAKISAGNTVNKSEQKESAGWKMRVVAAIIILISLASITYYQTNVVNMQTAEVVANEQKQEVVLPDGTTVTLNQFAVISYPSEFNEEIRYVYLEGEAFFDVTKNGVPFIIQTSKSQIQVLGTSFNVLANDAGTEVIVETGKVKLHDEAQNSVTLVSGEKGIYDNSNNEVKKEVNSDANFLAWKTEKIFFEEQPLLNVVSTLEKYYKVEIQLANQDIENCPLTASFNNQSLQAVLRIVGEVLNVKITQNDDAYVISGGDCDIN